MINDLTISSDALALVAVGVLSFTVALAGGLFGLVLGTVRLPGVLLVASSPAAGAGANLGISTLAAASAATAHVRAGNVDWRLLARMAPPSIACGLGLLRRRGADAAPSSTRISGSAIASHRFSQDGDSQVTDWPPPPVTAPAPSMTEPWRRSA